MTDDDARRLATRIIDTWPNAAKAYVWRDLLAPLDLDMAKEAYRRLEREVDRGAPTPGQFHAVYHGLQRAQEPAPTDTRHSLEDRLSPSKYLARVHARAQSGDHQAAEELERWERFTSGELFEQVPADCMNTLWER